MTTITFLTDDKFIEEGIKRIAERDAYIAQLREALQELCDLQNGPPFVRDADRWQAAMNNARALLSDKE